MNRWRVPFLVLVTGLLGLGYLGAMRAALNGEASTWSAQVDSAPVVTLTTVLAVVAVVFGLVKEPSE